MNIPIDSLNSTTVNTLLLISAAVSYSTGGYFMKLAEGVTKGIPTALVLALFCLGAVLQTIAMRHSEMSVSYIVVLGLEAITALALGMFLLGESISPAKFIGIVFVVVGIVVLRS